MYEIVSYAVKLVFTYCTDFMINLANLTGLSYYEVNALLFCLTWPVLTVALLMLFIVQNIRLHRARKARHYRAVAPGRAVAR